jgi:hypothetical protein
MLPACLDIQYASLCFGLFESAVSFVTWSVAMFLRMTVEVRPTYFIRTFISYLFRTAYTVKVYW